MSVGVNTSNREFIITPKMKKHLLSKLKLKKVFQDYYRKQGVFYDVLGTLETPNNVVVPVFDSFQDPVGFYIITIDEDSI